MSLSSYDYPLSREDGQIEADLDTLRFVWAAKTSDRKRREAQAKRSKSGGQCDQDDRTHPTKD